MRRRRANFAIKISLVQIGLSVPYLCLSTMFGLSNSSKAVFGGISKSDLQYINVHVRILSHDKHTVSVTKIDTKLAMC